MNKRNLLAEIFADAGRARGELNAQRARKLKWWRETIGVPLEGKALLQRRLTTEQENDLRQLLGSERFITYAEVGLWLADETEIMQVMVKQRRLKKLHDAAETLESFAKVLDRAENGQLPETREIPLFYYLLPSVADTLTEHPALGDAVLNTSGAQLRAWLEVIRISTEHVNFREKFGRRGPRKKTHHKMAMSGLVLGFCETLGDPRNSNQFREAAKIVLAPLNAGERERKERIQHLRCRPRQLGASPELRAELATLEKQQKKADAGRDWVRKLCDKALKDETWIDACMKLVAGNNSEK